MARVLLVGYIPELLQEPERVLRAAGFELTAASNFPSASTAIEQQLFDVAILGFSIPEAERHQMACNLRQASTNIKIIMIYFASLRNTELADAIMPTTSSPEELLRAVKHLLNKNRERLA